MFSRYGCIIEEQLRAAEVHNITVVLIVISCSILLGRTIRERQYIAIGNYILEIQGCLHLRGMSAYAKELQTLIRAHVVQLLRSRRRDPGILPPRIIISASTVRRLNSTVHLTVNETHQGKVMGFAYTFCSLPGVETAAILLHSTCANSLEKIIDLLRLMHESIDHVDEPGPRAAHLSLEKTDDDGSLEALNPLLQPNPSRTGGLLEPKTPAMIEQLRAIICGEMHRSITWLQSSSLPSTQGEVIAASMQVDAELMDQLLGNLDDSIHNLYLILMAIPALRRSSQPPWNLPSVEGVPTFRAFAEITVYNIRRSSSTQDCSALPIQTLHVSPKKPTEPSQPIPKYSADISRHPRIYAESSQPDYQEVGHPSEMMASFGQPAGVNSRASCAEKLQAFCNRFLQYVQVHSRKTWELLFSDFESEGPTPPLAIGLPALPLSPSCYANLASLQEDLGIFGFAAASDRDCLLCMTFPKDVVLLPCRHSSCCFLCLKALRQEKCPICRSTFGSYVVFPLFPSPQDL